MAILSPMTGLYAGILPVNLKCGSWQNPLGIDDPAPRLSWQVVTTNAAEGGEPARLVGQWQSGFRATVQCSLWRKCLDFGPASILAGARLGC